MTTLLEQAIARVRLLSEEEQNAIATMILEEIKDEKAWAQSFAETSDQEWDQIANIVREEIAGGKTSSLEEFLNSPTDTPDD